MPENHDRSVADYLSRGLGCDVEVQPSSGEGGIVFVPRESGFGSLHLGEDLVSGAQESDLLERLRLDGVDELLRKGERVKVTRVATEILPRAH